VVKVSNSVCGSIRENAVSGENHESDQGLENRFRSGGKEYLIFIIKSIGFSQSFLGVPTGGDIIWQKPNIIQLVIN
jgi:hypothetical protein